MNKPFTSTRVVPVRHKQLQHISLLLVGALKFLFGWMKGFGNKDILFVSQPAKAKLKPRSPTSI
jgi:hypothetical protein